MSAQALSAAMRADLEGAGRSKLLLIMLADACGEGGQGSCVYADAFKRSELAEGEGFALLDAMQETGILRWAKHPEEKDRIIFRFDYQNAVFGGAK